MSITDVPDVYAKLKLLKDRVQAALDYQWSGAFADLQNNTLAQIAHELIQYLERLKPKLGPIDQMCVDGSLGFTITETVQEIQTWIDTWLFDNFGVTSGDYQIMKQATKILDSLTRELRAIFGIGA